MPGPVGGGSGGAGAGSGWLTKPPYRTPIDPANELSYGLAGAWTLNEGGGLIVYNAATWGASNNGSLTTGGSVVPAWTTGPNGAALQMATANDSYVECGEVAALNGTYNATLFAISYQASAGNWAVGKLTTSQYRFGMTTLSGTTYFTAEPNASNPTYPNCAAPTGSFSLAIVYNAALSGWAGIAGYINGVPQTLTTGGANPNGAPLTSNSDTVRIGYDASDTAYSTGRFDLVLLWPSRSLSAAEVLSLHNNPWQVFARPPYALYKSPALGSFPPRARIVFPLTNPNYWN